MSSLYPVDVDVVVGKYGTSDGRDADGLFFETHLVDDFGNEFMHHAVTAPRAVMHGVVVEQARLLVNEVLGLYDILISHDSLKHKSDEELHYLQHHAGGNDGESCNVAFGIGEINDNAC